MTMLDLLRALASNDPRHETPVLIVVMLISGTLLFVSGATS